MELRLLEEKKGRAVVEMRGESQTLTGLIADTATQDGSDVAAILEHPFMADPKIVVSGSNPIKILEKAAENAAEKLVEFKKDFETAIKK